MTKVSVHTKKKPPSKHFRGLLNLLCWLKIIPVNRDHEFHILSLPSVLSTIWCLISLSIYLFSHFMFESQLNGRQQAYNATTNRTEAVTIKKADYIDTYILYAFQAVVHLLILLLPMALGHFYSTNRCTMQTLGLFWPNRGWMMIVSTFPFIVTIAGLEGYYLSRRLKKGMMTSASVMEFLSKVVTNVTAAILQLITVLMVNMTQTGFIKTLAEKREMIDAVISFRKILTNYENMRQGIGPLYSLAFCVHAPIILSFTYWGLSYSSNIFIMIQCSSSVAWSCMTIVHICLMSEDCYNAVQDLLPSLR